MKALKKPKQVGSYAWNVWSKEEKRKTYHVHTDAAITWMGDLNASFGRCSCNKGLTSRDRVVKCAHMLLVLSKILNDAHDLSGADSGATDG